MTDKISRRELLKSTGALSISLLTNRFLLAGQEESVGQMACKIGEGKLQTFSSNIRSGGQPPDGIPPIGKPKYLTAAKAENKTGISDESVVFGVDYEGTTKAYPQFVLVWHEIVNEEVNGQNLSITYCPLTGSVIGYKGVIGEKSTTFGTSGRLLNSNLVMYDRLSGTKSYWPQILGRSVQGPHLGDKLDFFPVIWTTWGRWKKKHPETQILSSDTGFIRAYGRDPYGSYQKKGTYYQKGGPMFGVMEKSNRFQPKKVVVGIKNKGCTLAVPKEEFRSIRLVNTELGGEPIVIVYEDVLDTVRAFARTIDGSVRKFKLTEDRLINKTDGSSWSTDGSPIEGPLADKKLSPVPFFDVMWFAWYSFYPDTDILET